MEPNDNKHRRRTEEIPRAFEEFIGDDVLQLADRGNITVEEFTEIHMNSYEREIIIPAMSDELLAKQIRHTLHNCGRIKRPASTYEEAIQVYAEEAARRLCKESISDATIEYRGEFDPTERKPKCPKQPLKKPKY